MSKSSAKRYGVVRIGDVLLGIPIAQLTEVFPLLHRTQLPKTSPLSLGGIELRGDLIPLVSLAMVCGIDAGQDDKRLGVVVEHDKRSLAFEVKEIVGIATIEDSQLRDVAVASGEQSALFSAVFAYEGSFVSVVDTTGLFATPGVQSTKRRAANERAAQTQLPPMMTFMAGGALFAVPAVEVYAAVPRNQIDVSAIASGPCLGEITYHNRRVPIICPVSVLGLGQVDRKTVSEFVVIRFGEDQVFGFAVDAIHDIRTYSDARKAKIPVWASGDNLIETVFICEDEEQIFSIDVGALRDQRVIREIAGLSKPDAEERSPEATVRSTEDTNLKSERERYLIIEANERLAIPLLQVSCILEPPAKITDKVGARSGFKGYFSRLGESVGLIDLREQLGFGGVENQNSKVLLTGSKSNQVGFLVDRVVSIEVSHWRENPSGDISPHDVLVQLGSGAEKQVLPYYDLVASFSQDSADDALPSGEVAES